MGQKRTLARYGNAELIWQGRMARHPFSFYNLQTHSCRDAFKKLKTRHEIFARWLNRLPRGFRL